ncbi:hypothetical protein G3I60_35590 [Streptomyces sp. SID13666]|uniref:hypothetical protein n=1 Tax=unclassified Streptomyces TaxID=2593676 RepID=UPI0013BFBF90|nr:MULTISPECIES: hypothetical protein [unclassified Streptomyces]MCZ4101288.1 hypothetical protein [Streptomyces sp. H39-C1]NEA59345.1 hypothetical protein [Streptomyces sp. SID13666]
MSQLRGLAERIHQAADDVPLTDARHCVSDNLDELDDRVRDIAGLIVHVTSAAAFADRETSGPTGANDATPRRVTALTRAVGTLGRALANLSAAVAHVGDLHHVASLPRSPERARDQQVSRSAVDGRLNSAHRHLHEAARQLLLDAGQLTPTSRGPHSLHAPSAAPVAPRPVAPAPTRTH